MRVLIVRWLIMTTAILSAAYFIQDIYVSSFAAAFFAVAVLGVLNALLKPVLILLTLPINILAIGFFTFITNAALLKLKAVLGALVISIVNWLLHIFIADYGK